MNWLGDSTLDLTAVIVAYVWCTTPFNILLYHAYLLAIGFLVLPLAPVMLAGIQSEKTIQGDTFALLPGYTRT